MVRGAHLVAHDAAVLQADNALADGRDDLGVVGGHQDGHAQFIDPQQELDDLPADYRIEVARRLVRDEEARVMDKGPGNRRSLLLAAGQLVGELVSLAREADHSQHAIDSGDDLLSRRAGDFERETDVVADGLVGQELEVLEHDADTPADLRDIPSLEPPKIAAVQKYEALGRQFVADQKLDKGGLARAGRSHEEHEVALGDHKVHSTKRDAAVGVGLRHALHRQDDPARDVVDRMADERAIGRTFQRGDAGLRASGERSVDYGLADYGLVDSGRAVEAALAWLGIGCHRAHHDVEASTDRDAGQVADITTEPGCR